MPTAKVAITIENDLLMTVDWLVSQGKYTNRSQAIQTAVRENLKHWKRTIFDEALKRVNLREERELADEKLQGDTWRKSRPLMKGKSPAGRK